MAKNGSIPSRNKKEEAMFVTNRETDGQTDGVNDKNNRLYRLGAEIKKHNLVLDGVITISTRIGLMVISHQSP